MSQAFEPLEGVVDEDPVLVSRSVGVDAVVVLGVAPRRRCTAAIAPAAASGKLEVNVWELVEVGGVVDGLDMHRYGRRPLTDVVPVNTFEIRQSLDVVKTLHPPLRIRTKPEIMISLRHKLKPELELGEIVLH